VSDEFESSVRRDPLFCLTERGNSRWIFAATIVLLNLVTLVVLPILGAQPQSPPAQPPAQPVAEPTYIGPFVWAVLGIPIGLFLYFWVPGAIAGLIPDLRANGVLRGSAADDRTLNRVAAETSALMDHWLWPLLGVAAVAGSIPLALRPPEPVATTFDPLQRLVAAVGTAIPVYAGTVMISRLIFGTVKIARSIGQVEVEPRVIPLHGDQAGGWGGFGRRFFVLAGAGLLYAVVAIVVNLEAIQLGHDPTRSPASLITLGYFILLPPLVVWAWFYAPHRAMLQARTAALEPLSRAFEAEEGRSLARPPNAKDPIADLRVTSDRMAELARRRDLLVAAYPGWPLRLVELRAVWATAFLPLVTAVITALAAIVSGWVSTLGG
jgi:hypothetical protein